MAGILRSRSAGRPHGTPTRADDDGRAEVGEEPSLADRLPVVPGAPAVPDAPDPPDGEVAASGHVRVLPDVDPLGVLAVARIAADRVPARPARQDDAHPGGGPAVDLRGLGLPEHLVPPDGGVFPLLSLLETMPQARLPSLRSGDDVVVVTVDPRPVASPDDDGTTDDDVAEGVARALRDAGTNIDPTRVRVLAWPCGADHRRTAQSELVEDVRRRRPRLELLLTEPDCPPTRAYAACRGLPSAQLFLTGVLRSRRPAAPLGWGAPVAFVDGVRAWPAVLAAVFADRLAGGVA